MATCTPPLTGPSAWLFLFYTHISQAVSHTMQIHLVAGVDFTDLSHMGGVAGLWSAALQNVLPTSFIVTGWGVKRPDGTLFYATAFSSPLVGTHGDAAGAEDYVSRTITITGHGIPSSPTACAGPARNVVFVGKAFNFTPKQKAMPYGVDPDFDSYHDWLTGHPDVWADKYGQKAGARPLMPVQFQGGSQRRNGT